MEATARKTGRLDLRMSDMQKGQIEQAAHLNGMSVSQWSISRLVEAARQEIAEQRFFELSTQAFDEFARLLEEPTEPRFDAFRRETTRWEA
ncbi:DUF1778 domain-containing protein [Collinsella sp. An2]|uniref:type II toxin-antitoxin system TacA family antitoxin n=1 Tax=Collinsella sp. An2 TaxID=1965585 RepID=UPI000B3AC1EA|nr:DUF1778 domain-containing protein [Collinsella sp. An2]OUP09231.1 hypothetical protein B5F33_05730 [Collinsella sp. An2]